MLGGDIQVMWFDNFKFVTELHLGFQITFCNNLLIIYGYIRVNLHTYKILGLKLLELIFVFSLKEYGIQIERENMCI